MTVHRLYKNKAFEPEAVTMTTHAYAGVCRKLGLSEGDRPEVNAVAKKVIDLPSASSAIRCGCGSTCCRHCNADRMS